MKVICFYVPQFHVIPENEQWWGKGFTEWVNVRNAKPLYEGHEQPREPLNKNYYNLLDIDTLRWQADLANKYGVYGFCFYHYWFGGKLLLEKPLELLLENKDIQINYCLCWANESWTNAWTAGKNCQTLIAQRYGGEEDWKAHFLYLLPYFQDERYIRVNGKPLLVLYRVDLIDDLNQMIDYLKKTAVEYGLTGLEIAYQHPSFDFQGKKDDQKLDYNIMFEPIYAYNQMALKQKFITLRKIKRKISNFLEKHTNFSLNNLNPYGLQVLDYDKTWELILSRKVEDAKLIPGGFVDWDNTPRRGDKGKVYKGASPEKFKKYMSRLIKKAKTEYKKDMIFLTAWNEWGEGSYMEPDERYQYGYLEALREALLENSEAASGGKQENGV